MNGWLLAALVVLGTLACVACGFALGCYVMAKVLQDEWRELRELLSPPPAQAPGPQELEWGMRVSPERYLERFPDGEHSALAREIVGRRGQAERQQRARAAFS